MTAEAAAEGVDSPAQFHGITPRRRNLVFVAVLLGMLLAALDQTIVATALPTVVADLGGAGHQSWVVTSYLLASTIATAIVGKLGDLFGRKAVFQVSVLFFFAGSVLCGMSSSMTMLVASRTLQGIGGGAIMVTAMAVIGVIEEEDLIANLHGIAHKVTCLVVTDPKPSFGLIRPCFKIFDTKFVGLRFHKPVIHFVSFY